jgi:hypothetical protein
VEVDALQKDLNQKKTFEKIVQHISEKHENYIMHIEAGKTVEEALSLTLTKEQKREIQKIISCTDEELLFYENRVITMSKWESIPKESSSLTHGELTAYCAKKYEKQTYGDYDLIPVTLHLIKTERSMTSEYILDVKSKIRQKVERINELHNMMKKRPEDDDEDQEDLTNLSAEEIAKKRKQQSSKQWVMIRTVKQILMIYAIIDFSA